MKKKRFEHLARASGLRPATALSASAVYLRAAEWLDAKPFTIMAYACLKAVPRDNHSERCRHMAARLGSAYPDNDFTDRGDAGVLTLLLLSEIAKDEERRAKAKAGRSTQAPAK